MYVIKRDKLRYKNIQFSNKNVKNNMKFKIKKEDWSSI